MQNGMGRLWLGALLVVSLCAPAAGHIKYSNVTGYTVGHVTRKGNVTVFESGLLQPPPPPPTGLVVQSAKPIGRKIPLSGREHFHTRQVASNGATRSVAAQIQEEVLWGDDWPTDELSLAVTAQNEYVPAECIPLGAHNEKAGARQILVAQPAHGPSDTSAVEHPRSLADLTCHRILRGCTPPACRVGGGERREGGRERRERTLRTNTAPITELKWFSCDADGQSQ
jgi:hypothetical protein